MSDHYDCDPPIASVMPAHLHPHPLPRPRLIPACTSNPVTVLTLQQLRVLIHARWVFGRPTFKPTAR